MAMKRKASAWGTVSGAVSGAVLNEVKWEARVSGEV